MATPIRVLVVDDSAFMRHTIADKLLDTPEIRVIGSARDGIDALSKIVELKPDVVTLDVEMPRMDGLTALERIMDECPCPVIMLSSHTGRGAATTLRALELGAVDFVLKPSEALASDLQPLKAELLSKITNACAASIANLRRRPRADDASLRKEKAFASPSADAVVIIGSSTGGPRALFAVLSRLPGDLPAATLVVQHMPAGFTRSLAERLDEASALNIREAQAGDRITRGAALMAPGDYHMLVAHGGEIRLDRGPRLHGVRPSIDMTMESVAKSYAKRCIGVILTGMGQDGTAGAAAIRGAGGFTIAEHESTSVIYGMPRSVIEAGCADRVAPLNRVADEIMSLIAKLTNG